MYVCSRRTPAHRTRLQSEVVADIGSTAWILTSSALVLFMTLPGLALFYGGLVRARNLLSVIMHCFAICGVVSVLWIIFGYSLALGEGGALIGPLDKAFLAGVDADSLSGAIPEYAFVMFQLTFAVITPALIIGAFVERIRFSFVLAFSALWLLVVYLPVCHWVWGGGWLAADGVSNFAGGMVVHSTAGVSALVIAALLGPRANFPRTLLFHPIAWASPWQGRPCCGWVGSASTAAAH